MQRKRPLIGFPTDTFTSDGFVYHSAGDKYLKAIADLSGCLPVMIPSNVNYMQKEDILSALDGLVLTGAASNVHPARYGHSPTPDHEPYDHARDALTLQLIRSAIALTMPILCICRGFQELNVAMGGTLETEIQTVSGRLDHRAPASDDCEIRYAESHAISIEPAQKLSALLGKTQTKVNSIHRQGIQQLAPGLVVEATAPDGIIEAVSLKDYPQFCFGFQWHPEFQAEHNEDSIKIFKAFGNAARIYSQNNLSLTGSRP